MRLSNFYQNAVIVWQKQQLEQIVSYWRDLQMFTHSKDDVVMMLIISFEKYFKYDLKCCTCYKSVYIMYGFQRSGFSRVIYLLLLLLWCTTAIGGWGASWWPQEAFHKSISPFFRVDYLHAQPQLAPPYTTKRRHIVEWLWGDK